eukprot:jgi/Psemu1/284865/fgenesh1_pg.66_\
MYGTSQPFTVVALQSTLKGPEHFKPYRLLTHRFPTQFYLSASKKVPTESTNNKITEDSNMIVRVRSNLGTTKLTIEDEDRATESTVRAALIEEQQRKTGKIFRLTQDLSFDPSGLRRINPSQTLHEQGLRHGSMVYCRLEEENSKDESTDHAGKKSDEEKNPTQAREKSQLNPKNDNDVIDLIDSSDDEDETSVNLLLSDDDDDDDDVRVISPRKIEASRDKTKSSKMESQPQKRQRLEMDAKPRPAKSSTTTRSDTSNNKKNPSNFQIASYNVWFGPPDPEANQVFPAERMKGIVKNLEMASKMKEIELGKSCPLLLIGLQELTPSLVQYLTPHLQNVGYRMCTQPLGGLGPSYGIGIAVPIDLEVVERRFVPYSDSIQGRGFLFVQTQNIVFATTHLESWCGTQYTGSKQREAQLIEVAQFCRDQLKSVPGLELAVITGDFNWDDERKQKKSEAPNRKLLTILPEGWNDTGVPFDYTYDAKENPMLGGNLRRRFDRCIYTTKQGKTRGLEERRQNYRSISFQKIGRESIPNLVWNKKNPYNGSVKKMPVSPSDHFGIVVSFSNEV